MKKNKDKGLLTGVCAGLADYFNTEAVYIRLLFAMAFIWLGLGLLLYILLWLFME